MTTWGRGVAVSSRSFDQLNFLICDLKWSVDLRRLFYSGAIILRWSCFPSVDALSCASSNEKAVCTCICISCKHRASYLCVSTCESSDCLKSCKLSCTDCMQTAFLQNAAACVSSGYQHCIVAWIVAMVTIEMLLPGMCWHVLLEVTTCCAGIGALSATEWFFPWMSEQVLLEITCRCAGILALFATIRLFPWVGSHMDSKGTSFIARIVELCTNDRLLSAVNHHVGFQLGRSVERIDTLFAFVIFLDKRMDLVDFGHFAWKILIFDLNLCI